ncbi:MAG: prenyltransferase [Rhodobacteraceae bacterium]|nr:MAG: prenyltransferase [Paracoccaceae bacterium]
MIRQDDDTNDTENVPLVLDVDGTLLRTDLLYETFWAALGHNLFATLRILLRFWMAPEQLKRALRTVADPNIDLLPVRLPVLDLAREAAANGRAVHLASGSDQGLVNAVAKRLDLPGEHFGSGDGCNLTGRTKAAFLTARFGEGGYDYAGDSRADKPCWQHARKVIAVAPTRRLSAWLGNLGKPVTTFDGKVSSGALIKEMRPHQWVKNLLLLLPLLISHDFQIGAVAEVLLAIAAFSIGASAIYIVNDLLDLEADRRHPEKRNRPIASGALPIRAAMAASALLVFVALGLALLVNPLVAALTLTYMASSLIYSLWLKKLRWVDIVTLACLFLLRVVTGAMAAQVDVSGWLLAFLFSVFFTLACVKRLTGLTRASNGGALRGRGYTQDDRKSLEMAAYAAVALSAVLFVAYTFSLAAAESFSSPRILVFSVIPIALWLVRVVRLSDLGKEDYDPVVFVTHDKIGLALAGAGVVIALLAS